MNKKIKFVKKLFCSTNFSESSSLDYFFMFQLPEKSNYSSNPVVQSNIESRITKNYFLKLYVHFITFVLARINYPCGSTIVPKPNIYLYNKWY